MDEDKLYIEDCFIWLEKEFGGKLIKQNPVIIPADNFFDKPFRGERKDAHHLLVKLSQYMAVDIRKIDLQFYSERRSTELAEGLISVPEVGEELTSGRYIQYDDGYVEIWVEESQLNDPISLSATLAHEMAHFKLLREGRIEENDEILTELTVLIFGLGIFNANASVVRMGTWSGNLYTGWQIQGGNGYLHYKLHGFALALFANYRNELDPDWINYLERDVLKVFRKSMRYVKANPDKIRFK